MAPPNTDWGEITTTTIHKRSKKTADNVSKATAGLKAIEDSKAKKFIDGGESIVEEFAYAENDTHMWYSGYDELDITPQEILSAYEFPIRQAAIAVSMSGLEELQNAGEAKIISLLSERIDNAEISARNQQSIAFYSDGTADGGKQMGGLQHLVPDDPTSGTVGGVSRVSNAFARSLRYRGVTDGGAAVSESNIRKYMNALYVQLCRGTEKPNVILADNNYWSFYHDSLTAIQQVVNPKNSFAESGFQTVDYKGVSVVLDGGYGGACPANHMYFLNTQHIRYRPHSARDWVPLKPDRHSTNQDAMVRLMAWAGNMTLRCAFLQGVLLA